MAGRPTEVRGSLQLPWSRDSAWVEAYVPAGVETVRAVVTFIDRSLDRFAYDDRDWRALCARSGCALLRLGLPRGGGQPSEEPVRNASIGGDAVLLRALALVGERSGHEELSRARVLLFGFSAAGNFGVTFAALHPDRTLGFIFYHSNMRGLGFDTAAVTDVPGLLIAGERDETAGTANARELWAAMRRRGAPWAFVVHPGQPHGSIDGIVEAGVLMRDWTEGILAMGTHGDTDVATGDGWLVDGMSGEVTPVGTTSRAVAGSSWLPTEVAALGFKALGGLCGSVAPAGARALLAVDSTVSLQEQFDCRFSSVGGAKRELWLTSYRATSPDAARSAVHQAQAVGAMPMAAIGDAAYFAVDSQRRCGTLAAARSSYSYTVSICGDDFAIHADTGRLRPVMLRLLGAPLSP